MKVFLKPNDKLMTKVEDLKTSIDAMIVADCWMDNNPMRKETGGPLFWNWAIIEICGERIPVPYHPIDEENSVLYDYRNERVEMSNKQCAITTAKFYLTMMLSITNFIERNKGKIDPWSEMVMTFGSKWLQKVGQDKVYKILSELDSNLEEPGWRVLN